MQWTTRDSAAPEAFWGTDKHNLDNQVPGDSFSYTQADLCGAPATTDGWVDPGTLHKALFTGLAPNTRYYYKYGEV